MFTEKEINYIKSQPLGRLATVSVDHQPDNSPVGYEFDGKEFYIGGRNLIATRKYKNIENGNNRVALVIDDLESINPWKPRGIRIFGTAEIRERTGRLGFGVYIHVIPSVSWSWNVESDAFVSGKFTPHKTIHQHAER